MITRLKHGVKGRFDKANVKQRTEQRMKERAETIRDRLQGHVQIGPLDPGQFLKEKISG